MLRPEQIDCMKVVRGHDGLWLPAMPSIANTRSTLKHMHETASWIGRLVYANSDHSALLQLPFRGIDCEPTPNHRIAIVLAKQGPGPIPERVTLGRIQGEDSAYDYRRSVVTFGDRSKLRETLAIDGEPLYDGTDLTGYAQVKDRLRAFMPSLLEDLGYGDPASFDERAVSLQQALEARD